MHWLRYTVLPFSYLYGGILSFRDLLFEKGILKIERVKATVVSVGNLSVGGTGKTPHVDWLASRFKEKVLSAVLLRGYGRKTKGFMLVGPNAKPETVGDEALLYKSTHGDKLVVAVCEKRVEGAKRILELHPKTELIILDDAFQHRYIHRDVNILLTDYSALFYKDFVMPVGRLREFRFQKRRADVVVVTKCPDNLTALEKERIRNKMKLSADVLLCFSKIKYGNVIPFFSSEFEVPEKVLLITGIATPEPLVEFWKKIADVTHLSFPDHHDFTRRDIDKIHNKFDTFATHSQCIVTTSKDYVRLCAPEIKPLIKDYPWFYQEITVEIDNEEELLKKIYGYVEENRRSSSLPQ
ncbi:MAG: tetraacyldisaccharide 4'-kinase [Brumimicrobium sp.]|nr:tetraacyldisaccharide 4'-kinase [Brumimicrobium sp.]